MMKMIDSLLGICVEKLIRNSQPTMYIADQNDWQYYHFWAKHLRTCHREVKSKEILNDNYVPVQVEIWCPKCRTSIIQSLSRW